ncbi:hypothetical protein AHAS_Ahas16G0186800 [Arachis hypogaea]
MAWRTSTNILLLPEYIISSVFSYLIELNGHDTGDQSSDGSIIGETSNLLYEEDGTVSLKIHFDDGDLDDDGIEPAIREKIDRTKASSGCHINYNMNSGMRYLNEDPWILKILQTYYGSRSMVVRADLLVLPYQSLLSKSSREALGLNLKSNIDNR